MSYDLKMSTEQKMHREHHCTKALCEYGSKCFQKQFVLHVLFNINRSCSDTCTATLRNMDHGSTTYCLNQMGVNFIKTLQKLSHSV